MFIGMFWSAAGAEEIVIGYTGPLSGPASEYGQDCLNGLEIAVNEINANGGIIVKGKKYSFRVEKMDDQTNPQMGLNNVVQMRKAFKTNLIFSAFPITTAALMRINMAKNNEFLIMDYSNIPQVSEMGNELLVSLLTPYTCNVKIFSDIAWEKGWRKAALVVTTGPYGESWGKTFRGEWEKKKGIITSDKATDFFVRTNYSIAVKVALADQPDFIVVCAPSATAALFIEEARAKGFEGGFIISEAAKLETIHAMMEKPLGLEGAIGVAMLTPDFFPASGPFIANYKDNYRRVATWEVVINYTSMYALAKAIAIADTATDIRAIRAAFPKVFPMLGDKYPGEYFGMTPQGRLFGTTSIQTVKHGRFTKASIYVWWAKTQKEFDHVRKISQSTTPLSWLRAD
jgi:branched-chain amino acid transport system substrate-binding protein